MSFVPDCDGADAFTRAFASSIIAWNHVENEARNLLITLSKGGLGSFAAIMALGNVALADALWAVVEYVPDREAADHIGHFLDAMDRQRVRRNFYVHSMWGVSRTADGQDASGILLTWDVKGSIHHVHDFVSLAQLVEFSEQLEELRLYAVRINDRLRYDGKRLAAVLMDKQPTWPEKPPLPEKLKKRRQSLREFYGRPQASEA